MEEQKTNPIFSYKDLIDSLSLRVAKLMMWGYLPGALFAFYRNFFVEWNPLQALIIDGIWLGLLVLSQAKLRLPSDTRLYWVGGLVLITAISVMFRNQQLGLGALIAINALFIWIIVLPKSLRLLLPLVVAYLVIGLGYYANLLSSPMQTLTYAIAATVFIVPLAMTFDVLYENYLNRLSDYQEKDLHLDIATKEAGFAASELDIANDTVRLVIGESPNKEAFEKKRDFSEVYSAIYGAENVEKIRHLLKHPTQTLVLPAFWKSFFDHYAQLSVSMPFERNGRQYQLIYRRMVDDVLVKYHKNEMDRSHIQRSIFYVATPFNKPSWRAGKTQKEKDALQAAFERGEKVI